VRSFFIAANAYKVVLNVMQNLHSLITGAVKEQMLAKVIAIVVYHQRRKVNFNLTQKEVH